MIDPLVVWKPAWDALPLDPTGAAWSAGWASLFASRVDAKLTPNPFLFPGPPSFFTFNQAAFIPTLIGLPPDPTTIIGVTAIASAWQTAMFVSLLVVPSGVSIAPVPTPATTFSAPPVVVPIPIPSFTALLAALIAAPITTGPLTSLYPDSFRAAFASMTYSVSGINSLPIPTPISTVMTVI